MTDHQYVRRVENLIRVVSAVRDEDFNIGRWCDCAIGHAVKDPYFRELVFDPLGCPNMGKVGEFFDISIARAAELFLQDFCGKRKSRTDMLAALRVLLREDGAAN